MLALIILACIVLIIGIISIIVGIELNEPIIPIQGFILIIISVVIILIASTKKYSSKKTEMLEIAYKDELIEECSKEQVETGVEVINIKILNNLTDVSRIEYIEILQIDTLCYLVIKPYGYDYRFEKINCNTFNIEKL